MFEKIQSYLANQLDISPDDITRDTTFESLGADHHRIKVIGQGNLVCATVTEYGNGRRLAVAFPLPAYPVERKQGFILHRHLRYFIVWISFLFRKPLDSQLDIAVQLFRQLFHFHLLALFGRVAQIFFGRYFRGVHR